MNWITRAGYSFTAGDNRLIQSGSSIHLASDFSVRELNNSGAIHLLVLPQTMSWDIAVMNDVKLNNLARYEKLELGITLPEPLKTKLENFILQQENPDTTINPGDMINPFLEWELDVEAEFTHQESAAQKVDAFFTIDKKRNYTTLLWDDVPSDYHMRIRFAPPQTGGWSVKIKVKSNNVLVAESISFPIHVVESGNHGYISVHPNNKNLQLDGEVIFPVGQNFPHTDTHQDLDISITGVPNPYSIDDGKTEFANNVTGWQDYIDGVDLFGQMGGRFTRIFMAPHAGLVEWEEKGNYYRRMHHVSEIDSLIEVHEKNNMFVMFDLLLHNYFMTYSDYNNWQWDWDRHMRNGNQRRYPSQDDHGWELSHPIHPYNDNPGNYLDPNQHPKMPHDMFIDESDIKYHEQRTRYYISRYGYSTSIYLWEQMEEVFHMSEDAIASDGPGLDFYSNPSSEFYDSTHSAVNNYVRRMNKYIRENLGHKSQLLALNVTSLTKYDENGQEIVGYEHDYSRYDPNGDCMTQSFYPNTPNYLLEGGDIGNHDDPDYNTISTDGEKTVTYQNVERYRFNYYYNTGRFIPMLISEGGANIEVLTDLDCVQGRDEFIDNMRFGFIGFAGFNKFHYLDGNRNGVYESIIRAERHMNGADVKNVIRTSDYLQGRQYETLNFGSLDKDKGDVLEMHYYLGNDKNAVIGYVYNRTVNYKTASGGNCSSKGDYDFAMDNFNNIHSINWDDDGPFRRMKIADLPNGKDYVIDFYDGSQSNYPFSRYTAHTSFNHKFIVEFPELNQSRPVVWFVAKKLESKSLNIDDTATTELDVEPNKLSELIFPNPTISVLYVPKLLENFVVHNAMGQIQELRISNDDGNYLAIDVSGYASGMYFIVSTGSHIPLKFIKL